MRLSSYPYVILRISCLRCSRRGSYRLARLADRYGAEMHLPHLVELLSADCKLRETSRANVYDRWPGRKKKAVAVELRERLAEIGWTYDNLPLEVRDLLIRASLAIGAEAALLQFGLLLRQTSELADTRAEGERMMLEELKKRAEFFGW